MEENIPDCHFFALPMVDNKMLSVDIGTDTMFDVDFNDNEPVIMTRKNSIYHSSELKFILYHPSLPLDMPENKIIVNSNDFVKCNKHRGSLSYSTLAYEQYDHFPKMFPRYQGILDSSKNEMFSHEINSLLTSLDDRKKFNKVSQFRWTQSRIFFGMEKSRKRGIKTLAYAECISDIPKNLILELLDEGLFQEYDNFKYNYNQRNCVTSFSQNNRTFIFCSKGTTMSEVVIKEITVNEQLLDSTELLRIDMGFRIIELSVLENLLLSRGDYRFSIFQIVSFLLCS